MTQIQKKKKKKILLLDYISVRNSKIGNVEITVLMVILFCRRSQFKFERKYYYQKNVLIYSTYYKKKN